MIVVDTNVLVSAVFEREGVGRQVIALDADTVVPPLWRSEFRSALAGLMRNRALSEEEALAALELAEAVAGAEVEPVSDGVLALIAASSCSAYDLEFVAVAQQLGVPFVTHDREVLGAFPAIAVSPAAFVRGARSGGP